MQKLQQTIPAAPTAESLYGDRLPHNVEQAGLPGFQEARSALLGLERPIDTGSPRTARSTHAVVDRLICYMAMRGYTNIEIGEHVQMAPATVANILKQPASQVFMTEEMRAIAKEGVEDLLKNQVAPSLLKLIEMRDSAATPAAVRKSVIDSILDRALGKPTQHIKSEGTMTYDDASRSLAEIDRELEALRSVNRKPSNGAN